MDPPSALTLECPNCGRTSHRVLKGRLSSGEQLVLEGTVRCLQCGYTRKETYREWAPLSVPVVVSRREVSRKGEVELFPQEVIRTGDPLEVEGERVVVTAIERGDRRVEEAIAEAIDTLWTRRVEGTKVKFSLNRGQRTLSFEKETTPEEEFGVGDLVELGRHRGVVHRIKTSQGLVREGRVPAKSIVRVYCKPLRGGGRR